MSNSTLVLLITATVPYKLMPQAGFEPPPRQREVCYQTTALPPSHHGWPNNCRVEVFAKVCYPIVQIHVQNLLSSFSLPFQQDHQFEQTCCDVAYGQKSLVLYSLFQQVL